MRRKAFLSHSSKDKALVDPIFRQLGAANVQYDAATFEHGNTSAAEIFDAIKVTNVFVLFVSRDSINSPWVKTELSLAQHYVSAGEISKVLVFLLDDSSATDLPEWLRTFVYRRTTSPGVIVNAIRSTLLDIALQSNPSLNFFVGRDKEMSAIKDALSSLTDSAPTVLFVGGNDGIGRRTLAKRAISDIHPQLIRMPVEITLGDEEGHVELYRALLNQTESLRILEASDRLDAFAALADDERCKVSAEIIEKLADQKQLVIVRGKDAIVDDGGLISGWLAGLMGRLSKSPWPKLVVISRRLISPSKRGNYPNTYFVLTNSLDHSDSKRLLSIWMKHLGLTIDNSFVDDICQHVTGHPRNIQVAARYAAELGVARLQTERVEFIETLRQQSKIIVDGLKLQSEREQLLALFAEYEYLSAEDLLIATNIKNEELLSSSIGYLQDHGILESDGTYIRLAPYLPIVLSRHIWSPEAKRFVDECRSRLIQRFSTLSTTDEVDISTIDSSILSALYRDPNASNPLLNRCLLPSHLLRVARSFYDSQEYSRTIQLARRAYDGRGKLTFEAEVEALRLWCLAAVRVVGGENDLEEGLAILAGHRDQLSRRNLFFINGFKARYDGRLDQAEADFRAAHKLGGERNFHILRELSQLCRLKDNFVEAESFARAAFRITDKNPFVVDVLLEILIERHRDNRRYLEADPELERLFAVLEETARYENRSFYESRRAQYYGVLRDSIQALEWARRAVATTPKHIPVLLTLARIELDSGATSDARSTLDKIGKLIHSAGSNLDRRHVGDLDKLMVILEIQAGDFAAARTKLNRAPSLPRAVRDSLAKKIDTAEAYSRK
jgi:tetratricopeptide (TPR) repeat protein